MPRPPAPLPHRLLLCPGPSNLQPRVRAALGQPLIGRMGENARLTNLEAPLWTLRRELA